MIRLPAEWEKQEVLLLTFPHKKSDWLPYLEEIQESYVSLLEASCKFQPCILLCDNVDNAKEKLGHIENLTLVHVNCDDTWIRDYGPIDVFEDGKVKAYDFTFNAWGDKFGSSLDNLATRELFKQGILKGERSEQEFILEGGSIDSNGDGVLLTTTTCLLNKNRNAHLSKEQIESKIKELLGLKKIIWLENGHLSGDDTDAHVDTLARFLDKNTIAYVTCKDKNDEHYEPLLKMEEELKATGFDLVGLPLPEAIFYDGERLPATYANFIFVNDAVIVPTYNQKSDEEVLQTFKDFFPNRKIVGVDARVFIRQHGSLHCASMNVYKSER